MMPKVSDVLAYLSLLAPQHYALDFDNVGLLIGNSDAEVSKILVALDITKAVIDEAGKLGAELIVAHHPVIFGKLSRVVQSDLTGSKVIALIESQIAAICMHTNLDAARGGVNDVLAQKLGLCDVTVLDVAGEEDGGAYGIGRVGTLASELSLDNFLQNTLRVLSCKGVRYHDAGRRVSRVAVGGGSCGGYVADACKRGCDTLVTADIKHDQWLTAQELGINLVDAGHFSTEDVICPELAQKLTKEYQNILVVLSRRCVQPFEFMTEQEEHYGA